MNASTINGLNGLNGLPPAHPQPPPPLAQITLTLLPGGQLQLAVAQQQPDRGQLLKLLAAAVGQLADYDPAQQSRIAVPPPEAAGILLGR